MQEPTPQDEIPTPEPAASAPEVEEQLLPTSDTPDSVVATEAVEEASEPDAEEVASPADDTDSAPDQPSPGENPAANQAPPSDAGGELPDGLVEPIADDSAGEPLAVDPHIDLGLLEAYLFSTHSPLTAGKLAELFDLESTQPIRKALRLLNEQYEQTRRCFRVEQVAGGFQLLTLPDFGDKLKALHQREADAKLTKAALETLAIIAYKQPILRADLEAIRGVASGETIRSLMEKHLVKIAGRAEEPGRPILYGSTKRFLEVFGLNSLKDLPQPESLQAKARQMARVAQSLMADEGQTTPAETAPEQPTLFESVPPAPAQPETDQPFAESAEPPADPSELGPSEESADERAAE